MNDIDEVTLARIKKIQEENIKHSLEAPTLFLEAWKRGAKIVGLRFFECKQPLGSDPVNIVGTIDLVTDKAQLTPKWDYIENNIGILSGGEAALLAVMCSFYNSEWGDELMRDLGLLGMANICGKLDRTENQIVADLVVNYSGW